MSIIDQIIGVESGGNPNARNPNSTAGGSGQFIDRTWLAMLAKHRPDLTGSPEDLLKLKFDPQLSKAMTEAYASDNGAILAKAGHQVTPGSTYLAHFAGPQGATSVLGADPAAPVAQILGPAVIKANPFLASMTAGDLRAWADRKMGGQAPKVASASPVVSPVAPPQQAPLPAQSGVQAPIFGGSPAAPTPAPSLMAQMPAEQPMPQPIFSQQRKAVDLSSLRAALDAAKSRGPIFS